MRRKYVTPKLDGHRVALRGRVFPAQHARATIQAARHGLSLSDYLAALIDRDSGLPTVLDNRPEALTPEASQKARARESRPSVESIRRVGGNI